jgi:hypothetical protein
VTLDLVLVIVAALPAAAAAAWMAQRGPDAMTRTFRGIRPDPWPRGVQEEYRDAPWGAGGSAVRVGQVSATDGRDPSPAAVPTMRVSARVAAGREGADRPS